MPFYSFNIPLRDEITTMYIIRIVVCVCGTGYLNKLIGTDITYRLIYTCSRCVIKLS